MGVLEVTLLVVAGIAVGLLIDDLVQRARLTRARVRIAVLENGRAVEETHRRRPAPKVVRRAEKAVKVMTETAAMVRSQGVGGLVASSIEELTEWVQEDRLGIARVAAPDGTVTMFFSDIEGSTQLNVELGDRGFMKLLTRHDMLVRAAIERHHGHVVKTQGDGFMVAFGQPGDAARAAQQIQRQLEQARGRLRAHGVRVRIGMHRGAVVARGGDYFGSNVAMAARVAAAAVGGEILVSNAVRESLLDTSEFVFEDVRTVDLKGFTGAHQLWILGR